MIMSHYKVLLARTEQRKSEPDLTRMVECLSKFLSEIERVAVDEVVLSGQEALPPYDHLVLCGYDHVTLAHLHLALDRGDRVTMYDEPGRSLQSELSNIFFRGVDTRRLPASSLDGVEYSWSYRDIVSVAKKEAAKLPSEPESGSSARANSSRQVENTGNTSTRKRNGTAKVKTGEDGGAG